MQDPATDKLVQQAMAGDQAALRDLWESHRRWVAAILLAHLPREAELDDLLQEVAASVVARIGGLRDPGSFKPWLRAVALNAAGTAVRRRPSRAVRALARLGLVRDIGADDAESRRTTEHEEGARLLELAGRMPEGYREPLLMRCVQGMSYREIGQVLGLPETTIETRITRGRKMLREAAEAADTASARKSSSSSSAASSHSVAPVTR